MQASPLVGAPWRSTSSTSGSASGPYSEPYLICKSNLIFGGLIGAIELLIGPSVSSAVVIRQHAFFLELMKVLRRVSASGFSVWRELCSCLRKRPEVEERGLSFSAERPPNSVKSKTALQSIGSI